MLRRVMSDLREIRWDHVLVELVLVIAGILIALWVNDWMEALARRLEHLSTRHTLRFNPTTYTDLIVTGNVRLWTLPAGAPEWTILRNNVWQRGSVAEMADQQLTGLADEVKAVRKAVGDERAARHRPGD